MIYMKLTNFWTIFIANEIRWLDLRAIALGFALRWETLDEDITVPGVVAGNFELPLGV